MKSDKLRQIASYVQSRVFETVKHALEKDNIKCSVPNLTTGKGLCAIGSYTLLKSLQSLSTMCVLVEAYNFDRNMSHCWVETPHYAIDITSRQFNTRNSASWPSVLVMRKELYETLELLRADTVTRGKKAEDFVLKYWTRLQNPTTYWKLLKPVVKECKQKFG